MPTEYTDLIIYTGFGEPGRDLLFSRSADAIIVGCGRVGSLHEFTVAFQEGKPVGILEGKGSIAPMVKEIMQQGEYPTNSIIFDEDPIALVSKIFALVKEKRHLKS
jgi:predicted Rossmann-fold nucleotide-binding protein